jgi:DHA1 family multidrug resistance protein-like MFS transporter
VIALPRWKTTFVASWIAQVFSIIGFALVVPFLPFYVKELGVPDERQALLWTGWLSSGAGVTMALFAPLWGVLADRYGRKLMVMRSMFGGAVVLGLMGLVTNVHQLLFLRIMQGVLTGTVSASVALVSTVVPERRAGYALGLMQTALMIGNSLGPWIGGHCAMRYGYRVPFLVSAGFLLVGAVLTLVAVHEDFDPEEAHGDGEASTLRQVLSLEGLTAMLLLMFMLQFVASFVGPVLPFYIQRLGQLSDRAAGVTNANISMWWAVAAGLSAALLGRMSDRWGHTRVMMGCLALNGLVLFPHALVRDNTQLLLMRILSAVAGAGISPSANALIRALVPRHACGKAFGVVQSCANLGWGLGPMVGSALAAAIGLRWPFVVVGGAFLIISALAALMLPRMQRAIAARQESGPAESPPCALDAAT